MNKTETSITKATTLKAKKDAESSFPNFLKKTYEIVDVMQLFYLNTNQNVSVPDIMS